jgi:hypothetical protein
MALRRRDARYSDKHRAQSGPFGRLASIKHERHEEIIDRSFVGKPTNYLFRLSDREGSFTKTSGLFLALTGDAKPNLAAGRAENASNPGHRIAG